MSVNGSHFIRLVFILGIGELSGLVQSVERKLPRQLTKEVGNYSGNQVSHCSLTGQQFSCMYISLK